MSFAIRAAVPADVPLILSLIRELAAYEREPDAVLATEADLHRALFGERAVAEAVIAERGGEAVGLALYFTNFSTWTGKPGIYLEDLYVRPHARGGGVGGALLSHIARIAVERGCARFEWAVLDWNEPAIRVYEALGAVPMDEWTIYRLTGEALEKLSKRTDPAGTAVAAQTQP